MADQFMQELVCSGCGHTGHITWEGAGAAKRVVNMSESLDLHPGNPPTVTCTECGTVQAAPI
jgi:hypothetical protein